MHAKDAKVEPTMSSVRKIVSETNALRKLNGIRERFRESISNGYEHRAKPCSSCPTFGACCSDEHFVNVRISRLEATAIKRTLDDLNAEHRADILRRTDQTVDKYCLEENPSATYSCPLFERGKGCLVHHTAKPLPCINHACYEHREDLPPDSLLDEAEIAVERLNQKVYGRSLPLISLPIAIKREMDPHIYTDKHG